MIRSLLSIAMLLLLAIDAPATTLYVLTGGVAAPRSADFQPPCQAGRCANYRADNVVTGWFTTPYLLPPNLDRVDIYPLLAGFGFSDGVSIHSSGNPDSRMQSFVVSSTADGRITVERLWVVTWTSGARPHSPGYCLNSLTLAGGTAGAQNNDFCTGVSSAAGFGVETGIDDACPMVKGDMSSSAASSDSCMLGGTSNCSPAPAAWLTESLAMSPPLPIPALSAPLVTMLALLLGAIGSIGLRGAECQRARHSRARPSLTPARCRRPSVPSTT